MGPFSISMLAVSSRCFRSQFGSKSGVDKSDWCCLPGPNDHTVTTRDIEKAIFIFKSGSQALLCKLNKTIPEKGIAFWEAKGK